MLSQRQTLLSASLLGALAVALGAFGSHAFKPLLIENNRVDTYDLAVRYHFYHSLALLFVGLLIGKVNHKSVQISAAFILTGTILFSGSLYTMALLNTAKVALVTPVGGVLLLTGWALLCYSLARKSTHWPGSEK
jgi:uncharacterized membrane protein YgdD (TMEM256/DUF423 family)